ncbi:hypothetical protein Mapa_003950 [Marchantia paleacea]|nr:hypothetical protein Mapa_003950 [Marchantia paleacea]
MGTICFRPREALTRLTIDSLLTLCGDGPRVVESEGKSMRPSIVSAYLTASSRRPRRPPNLDPCFCSRMTETQLSFAPSSSLRACLLHRHCLCSIIVIDITTTMSPLIHSVLHVFLRSFVHSAITLKQAGGRGGERP